MAANRVQKVRARASVCNKRRDNMDVILLDTDCHLFIYLPYTYQISDIRYT